MQSTDGASLLPYLTFFITILRGAATHVMVVIFVAIDIAILALMLVARPVHKQWAANLCAFIISSAAACVFSLAIQITFIFIFIMIAGMANELQPWFILGYAAAGLIGLLIAHTLKSPPWVIASPFGLLGAINLAYGLFVYGLIGVVTGGAMAVIMLVLIYVLPKRTEVQPGDYAASQERGR